MKIEDNIVDSIKDEFEKNDTSNAKRYTYNIINDVYNWMISKKKDVEVRILKEKSEMINVNDYITFNNQDKENEYVVVKVINKVIVDNLDELLSIYDVNRIMPGHTKEDLIDLMNKIYGNELTKKKIVAFEFEYLYSDMKNNKVLIEEISVSDIDINDNFFDSLKKDYDGFENWFKKKQNDGYKAYVTTNDNKITSFLMLKIEDGNELYDDFSKSMRKCKRLKICTLKVSDNGKKIGDEFLKIILRKAQENNVDEIYVTLFRKYQSLIKFLKENNFKFYCYKNTHKFDIKEDVYIRKIK